ncbi:MAG: replication initiation factor domain-containing protein [Paraglaciecola sp.]|nr:replication initiation factor domain-containing protein [Paraglaciecola sp.]
MPANSKRLAFLNNEKYEKRDPNLNPIFIDYFKLRLDNINDLPAQYVFINSILNQHHMRVSERTVKPSPGYDKGYKICAMNNDFEVCGAIEFSEKLLSLAAQPNARLTRLDLAFDDYWGIASIQKVDRDYSRGLFDPISGKRPKKQNLGDKKQGRSRYIGGKTAYKKIVVYEKAKQLGITNIDLADWVRTEVRLTANSRDSIPNEVIEYRADYFYSAFPKAMRKLIGKQTCVPVAVRAAIEYQAHLGCTLKHARYQYGPSIKAARSQFTSDDLMSMLSREPKCDRYIKPLFVLDDDLKVTQSILTSMLGKVD